MSAPFNAKILAHSLDQGVQYDERSGADYQAGCIRDACELLDCQPEDARKWASNRNADLYLFDTRDGRRLMKILVSKPIETLECEFRSLQELETISTTTSTFCVPRPVALLEGRSAYLMEFVEGQPLDSLLRRSRIPEDQFEVLRICGQAIGAIHRDWDAGTTLFDSGGLRQDLSLLPWIQTHDEQVCLEAALESLDGREVSCSRLYLDWDPVNVLVTACGKIVLLDSPERVAWDVPEWDLGAFLFGLERLAWKWPVAARRLRSAREQMREAFLEEYAGARDCIDGQGNRVLLVIGSLMRLAQLWAWWLDPMGYRHRVSGVVRAAYAYPLLRRSRRSIYAELQRAVHAGTHR